MLPGDQDIYSFLDNVQKHATFDGERASDNVLDALRFYTSNMQLSSKYEQKQQLVLQYPVNPKSLAKQVRHWEQVFLK